MSQMNHKESKTILAITSCDTYEGQILASKLSDHIQAQSILYGCSKHQLVCLARNLDKCCRLKARPNCKVIQITYDDVENIVKALQGVHTVVLVPEIESQRVNWANNVVNAMNQEKIGRCILISSIGSDATQKKQLERFVQTEEKVKESFQHWTILRAGLPFQTLLYWVNMIHSTNMLGMPIGPDVKFTPLDIDNLGDALVSIVFPSKRDDSGYTSASDGKSDDIGDGSIVLHKDVPDLALDETITELQFDRKIYTITGPTTVTGVRLVDELNKALTLRSKVEVLEDLEVMDQKDTESMELIAFKQITKDDLRDYLVKLRDTMKLKEEPGRNSLAVMHSLRNAIKLFQQTSISLMTNSMMRRSTGFPSSYTPISDWSEIDDDFSNSDGSDLHKDSCNCKNSKKCHRPRLEPPNDDEVELVLELMEYIGEDRTTFQSGDLKKITGMEGSTAKDFCQKAISALTTKTSTMKVVGLTGGIASGKFNVTPFWFENQLVFLNTPSKSTVVSTIQTLGVPIIDCDKLARIVVEPSHPAYKKLVNHFGTVILQNQTYGQPLDRYKFGTIIFPDAAQRRVANSIIHPAVRDEILKRLFKYWIMGTSLVVIDVPLLLEGELWRIVSDIVVVYCPREVQLERIKSRDGLSEEDALARIDAQRPLIEKVEYADHVIYNTSDLESLKQSTLKLMDAIKPNPFWTVMAYFPPFTFLLASWVIVKRHLKGDPRKTASKNKGSEAQASSSSSQSNPPAHTS
ncbi:hypothetical protein BGZ46_003918 [Entomortierella lignicola]|nr:hypothetical protein BGZ46_003918 [Entomortierella lignicola]